MWFFSTVLRKIAGGGEAVDHKCFGLFLVYFRTQFCGLHYLHVVLIESVFTRRCDSRCGGVQSVHVVWSFKKRTKRREWG